jgi:hypothetical protein
VNIDLSTGTPPTPERTRQLAETLAEVVRVMNHATMHHEALGTPADADRVIREIASAASRLPQLLGQIGAWLAAEQAAGRIEVAGSGEYAGRAEVAVLAANIRLDAARAVAAELQEGLDSAASVTSDLASAAQEDGDDD